MLILTKEKFARCLKIVGGSVLLIVLALYMDGRLTGESIGRLYDAARDTLRVPFASHRLDVLPQTEKLECYEVLINDTPFRFTRSWSRLGHRQVIEEYSRRAEGQTYLAKNVLEHVRRNPVVAKELDRIANGAADFILNHKGYTRIFAEAFSMLGYVDGAKRNLGVLAFDNPLSGGSDYFISESSEMMPALRPIAGGDAPGRDIDGIPRLPHSKRLFSFERTDAWKGYLGVYDCAGGVAEAVSFLRREMPRYGWVQDEEFETAVQRTSGVEILAFVRGGGSVRGLRGAERVLMYVQPGRQFGRTFLMVLWNAKAVVED